MSRTDVHAPKNLKPEDYEFVGCGNYPTAEMDASTPFIGHLIDDGWRFDSEGAGCRHCGQFIIYYAILKHLPSHKLIKVGETCLDNRFDLANAEFQALRKAGKLNRERVKLSEKRTKWLAADIRHSVALGFAKEHDDGDGFYGNFVRFVERYGEASDKWVGAIINAIDRQMAFEIRRVLEQRSAKPVIEGRIKITGELVSRKGKDTPFGWVTKIVIKDDRGFKVYGTEPASLTAALDAQENEDPHADPVCVSLVATVKASPDDPTFGFFSRPVKGELL
jgi:hypothetical protein